MDALRYWGKLRTPPQTALKPIQAGRLKGKTDINPQWRYQAMTETFGPAGIGWKYSIDRLWTEPGAEGQICAFALVSVQVKDGETWSEAVPGIGGSMLIEKESRGLHTSDEAFKMAVTDALSVALKMFGVGADIYLGMNDSKYNRHPPEAQRPPEPPRQPVNRPAEKPHVPEFIPLENVLAEMDGAFSLAELGQIFTERQSMAKHHYSQGEFKQFVAKKDEMKAKLQGAA